MCKFSLMLKLINLKYWLLINIFSWKTNCVVQKLVNRNTYYPTHHFIKKIRIFCRLMGVRRIVCLLRFNGPFYWPQHFCDGSIIKLTSLSCVVGTATLVTLAAYCLFTFLLFSIYHTSSLQIQNLVLYIHNQVLRSNDDSTSGHKNGWSNFSDEAYTNCLIQQFSKKTKL